MYAFGMALKEAPTEAETATPPPLAAPPHADQRLTPRRCAAASPPLGIKTFQQVKNKIYARGEQKKEARNSFTGATNAFCWPSEDYVIFLDDVTDLLLLLTN